MSFRVVVCFPLSVQLISIDSSCVVVFVKNLFVFVLRRSCSAVH